MKKQIFILLILFITVCGIIGAQEATGKTAYYAKSVLIYKVYSHSMGFKVVYHKTGLEQGVLYIPFSWFGNAVRKGEIVYGNDRSYPFFTVFYRDGKFDYIRLYLQESHDHLSWGMLFVSAEEAQKAFDVNPDSFAVEY